MGNIVRQEELTIEDLGRGGLRLAQLKDGFRFGTDSVLLAWFAASFVRTNRPVSMLELGSGCGGAALLACARTKGTKIDCVEIMERPFEVLRQNIDDNKLNDRVIAYKGDIRQLPDEVRQKQYDVVFFNPPFYRRSDGAAVPEEKKERLAGRFEENGVLEDFVRTASSRLVPSSGFAVMVMKSERMAEAISLFTKHGLTPVRLMNVHSEADKNASLFLMAGVKSAGNAALKVLPPLIMHRRDDSGGIIETERLIEIYNKEHTDCFIS